MQTTPPLLNVADFDQLHHLDIIARAVVDGMQAGMHRSPHKGHSVDFADHRPYTAGDDLRHLDWKVLGKSDRLVLKRYEAETDMVCHIIIDGSASMSYQGTRSAVDKYRYASMVAATIAHITMQQQDQVSVQIFSEQIDAAMPPSQRVQFDYFCSLLEQHACTAGTDIDKGIDQIVAPSSRRGLVLLFSDCMGDVEDWKHACDRLAIRGHDVVIVWVLDPDEKDLGIDAVTRFLGLEDDGQLVCEPRAIRQAYQETVAAHRLALVDICRVRNISLIEASTDQAPAEICNKILVELHAAD